MKTSDLAWLVGIYEGEGCVDGGCPGSPVLCVTQKDLWLLRRLKKMYGGTISADGSGVSRWRLCGPEARYLFFSMSPYLSPRRQRQIRRAMRVSPKRRAHLNARARARYRTKRQCA